MKKLIRILSVALVAMMMLSVSSTVLAADAETVFIPAKLAKLNLALDLDDFTYPELSVKVTNLAKMYDSDGNKIYSEDCIDYYTGKPVQVKSITEDSVAQFTFSEKPDWFGAVLSSLDGGWRNIELDENGYGELEIGELHRQPGMWSWYASGDGWSAHGAGGDYPYSAGKDYGDYSVNVSYHRDGSAYSVTVTLKDAEDPFKYSGLEEGVKPEKVSVTFESVEVLTDCYEDDLLAWILTDGHPNGYSYVEPKPQPMSMWYLSHVEAIYPEGCHIIGVGADWRNDKKQNLASYRIAYAESENEIYKITYAPKTTSIYENYNGSTTWTSPNGTVVDLTTTSSTQTYTDMSRTDSSLAYTPSQTVTGTGTMVPVVQPDGTTKMVEVLSDQIHHYTADEPLFGEFYKSRQDFLDGKIFAVSGSGNKLNQWMQYNGAGTNTKGQTALNNGKRIKSIKKGTTSFKSPRVLY